ncbi:MAG: MBL fold metallo-hydrolase [Chthonomonadales bacterium]|nr:MBL fold metallo-hydrolase [Chthonomonadales bacterium]
MTLRAFNVGPMDNNTYLIGDEATREAFIVDPGFGTAPIMDQVNSDGWTVRTVLNTHAHLDHIAENALFVEVFGAGLALHPADRALMDAAGAQAQWFGVPPPRMVTPTHDLWDGEELALGGSSVRVIHTPGHSPGSVCFAGPDWIVVGDLIFAGGIGRADLPGGDYDTLIESIRSRILTLDDTVRLYPGHGPSTTVGQERRTNPFLR